MLSSVRDPTRTCLCVMRHIVDIDSHLSEPRIARFIDVQSSISSNGSNGSSGSSDSHGSCAVVPDSEAAELLTELREHKVTQRLSPSNITSFQLDWKTASVEQPSSTKETSNSQERCEKIGEKETSDDGVCDVIVVTSGDDVCNVIVDTSDNGVGDVVVDTNGDGVRNVVVDHKSYITALCDEFYSKLTTLIRLSCDDDQVHVAGSDTETTSSKPDATDAEGDSETEINKSDVDRVAWRDGNKTTTDAAAEGDVKETERITAKIEDVQERDTNRNEAEENVEMGRKANKVSVGHRQRTKAAGNNEDKRKYERNTQTVRQTVGLGETSRYLYADDTAVEVLQHLHFARSRCDVFHGREEYLKAVLDYVSGPSRLPMIIYGGSGCGKTSVMAKVVESVASWAESAAQRRGQQVKRVVTIVRFLGTTPMTSNVRNLLESVCRQLIAVYTPRSLFFYCVHFHRYGHYVLPQFVGWFVSQQKFWTNFINFWECVNFGQETIG